MKKVALFTTFYEAESGYSLVAVAETQIRMLLDHGYDPAVLVQEDFKVPDGNTVWSPKVVDLRPVIPEMELVSGVHEHFDDRMQDILTVLQRELKDIDVCITHDIILQEIYKEHNVAMRKCEQDVLWLHWIHSCPSPNNTTTYPDNCRYTPPPGYVVYPNSFDIPRVAQTYNLGNDQWRVKACRHAIDPLLVWPYDSLTKDLVKKSGLLDSEIACVYPARLDRGKQPEKIIRLLAGVQKAGYEPRLLVIDWQSQGKRFQSYIDELLKLAWSLNLKDKVHFTSRLDDRCSQGAPRQVVLELMDLSNVYIHPSRVETYSLTVHEAMLRGNLVCLNHDFQPMRELYGNNAIYFDFSSDRVSRKYTPNEQAFWNDEAMRLLAEFHQNRALTAKTNARIEWSPQALWREFERLLYLEVP